MADNGTTIENATNNGECNVDSVYKNAANATSGYDLPLYGAECGEPTTEFYLLHISALTCIQLSIACGIIVVLCSFFFNRANKGKNFFKWNTSERLVVYLALCDMFFNISHTMDHAYIVAIKDNIPQPECAIFGFMLAEFITAQNSMVNVVAINCFCLVVFGKKLNFGPYDCYLLLWTFGAPFCGAVIIASLGQFGPNGVFCYFDGVKGATSGLFYTTIPLLLVLFINSVLYVSTWKTIRDQALTIKGSATSQAMAMRRVHESAKTMMLFVAAFFIQWWALALFGTWQLITFPPYFMFYFTVTFSNIGGVLNGGIYVIIRWRKRERQRRRENRGAGGSTGLSGTGSTPDPKKMLELSTVDSSIKLA